LPIIKLSEKPSHNFVVPTGQSGTKVVWLCLFNEKKCVQGLLNEKTIYI